MSDTAAGTPDLQQAYALAYQVMRDQLYAPALFGKLASDYGFQPADDEEARTVLGIVDQLNASQQGETVKAASQRKQLLSQAAADLSHVTGAPPPAAAALDAQIKAAAAQLVSNNQELREAALLYRDYLGQVLAARQA